MQFNIFDTSTVRTTSYYVTTSSLDLGRYVQVYGQSLVGIFGFLLTLALCVTVLSVFRNKKQNRIV